jgi:hypothetical protein
MTTPSPALPESIIEAWTTAINEAPPGTEREALIEVFEVWAKFHIPRSLRAFGVNAPGFLEIQRARAALWLLEKLDGDHLVFRHADDLMEPDDLRAWTSCIAKDAIRAALDEATVQIEEAVRCKPGPAHAQPIVTITRKRE